MVCHLWDRVREWYGKIWKGCELAELQALPIEQAWASVTKRRERGLRYLLRLIFVIRQRAQDCTLLRRQRVESGAAPQTWEQYSREGQIWDLWGVIKWDDKFHVLSRAKHVFEMHIQQWIADVIFCMRLDKIKGTCSMKEVELSSSWSLMKAGG